MNTQPDQSAVRDRILGGLWGAVVGDALGVPVEFRSRAKCQRDPVTGLRGHGMHDQPAGTWSDDSSLLLCTVNSLLTGEFTHQHPRSRISCGFYCLVAAGLLRGQSVAAAHETAVHFIGPLFQSKALTGERHHFAKALSADLAKLPEAEIASGGHVVDTLTASLWCLLTSRNYEATVLKAVNLGGDTDTTAIEAGISGRDTPSPVDIDLGFHAPPEGANRRGMREPEKMRPAVAVG